MGLSNPIHGPWFSMNPMVIHWRIHLLKVIRQREEERSQKILFRGEAGPRAGRAGRGKNGPARIAKPRGQLPPDISTKSWKYMLFFASKIFQSLPTCWWCFLCFLCTKLYFLIYWISNCGYRFLYPFFLIFMVPKDVGVTLSPVVPLGHPGSGYGHGAVPRCSLFQLPGRWPGISAVGRAAVDELHPKPYHPKMAKTVVLGVFHMENGLKINLVEPPSSGTTSFCWYGFGHSSFGGFEYFGKGGEYIWPGHCWA